MNSGYIESVKQLRETLLIQEWVRGSARIVAGWLCGIAEAWGAPQL